MTNNLGDKLFSARIILVRVWEKLDAAMEKEGDTPQNPAHYFHAGEPELFDSLGINVNASSVSKNNLRKWSDIIDKKIADTPLDQIHKHQVEARKKFDQSEFEAWRNSMREWQREMTRWHQKMQKTAAESNTTASPKPSDGTKYDDDKPRMALVFDAFSRALTEVAKVGTFGASKYDDNNWLQVENGEERYTNAMLRHHFAEAQGEPFDQETGLLHAAHRAWNALAVLELKLRDIQE